MRTRLGTTKYYSQHRYGELEAHTSAWAGNKPYGETEVTKEQYVQALKDRIASSVPVGTKGLNLSPSDISKLQQQIKDIGAGVGQYAEGYIDPSYKQYRADAPTPSIEYWTEERKAEEERKHIGKVNIGTAEAPLYVPKGSPAEAQATKPKTQVLGSMFGGVSEEQPSSKVSSYAGPSVEDYLKSIRQPGDYSSRSKMADKLAIKDYTGTEEQNTAMLNMLKGMTVSEIGQITGKVGFVPKKDMSISGLLTGGGEKTISPPSGDQVNIGTEDAPLLVPEGSPAHENWKAQGGQKSEGGEIDYDAAKIQTDIDSAGTSKKSAFDNMIGIQTKLYEDEYSKAGMADIKDKIAQVDSDITTRKQSLNKMLLDERGKPIPQWMITGRLKLEVDAAKADLDRMIGERNKFADEYNSGIDDITRKVEYGTSDAMTEYGYWADEEERLTGLMQVIKNQ